MKLIPTKEGLLVSQATKDGYILCRWGGVFDMQYPSSQNRRGRVQEDGTVSPALTTEGCLVRCELYNKFGEWKESLDESEGITRCQKDNLVMEKQMEKVKAEVTENGVIVDGHRIRIRKYTPKECFRLMDFTDEQFGKAEQVNSNSQLYKQAGNSIVVNCLVAIMGQMFEGKEDVYRRYENRAD